MNVTWPRGAKSAKPQPEATPETITPTAVPTVRGGAPVKLQRNPMRIAASILAIVLAALGAAWLATTYRHTSDVVTVRQTVSRGEVIKREDLQSASITLDPAIRTIPKSQIDSLVGKRAASDLHTGTTVAPDQISNDPFPPKGGSVVGLYLSIAQMPQTTLRSGSTVRLVATPKAQDDAPAAGSSLQSFTATVVGSKQLSDGSHFTVDVLVPTNQAAAVAALDATQRLAIVLDGE